MLFDTSALRHSSIPLGLCACPCGRPSLPHVTSIGALLRVDFPRNSSQCRLVQHLRERFQRSLSRWRVGVWRSPDYREAWRASPSPNRRACVFETVRHYPTNRSGLSRSRLTHPTSSNCTNRITHCTTHVHRALSEQNFPQVYSRLQTTPRHAPHPPLCVSLPRGSF